MRQKGKRISVFLSLVGKVRFKKIKFLHRVTWQESARTRMSIQGPRLCCVTSWGENLSRPVCLGVLIKSGATTQTSSTCQGIGLTGSLAIMGPFGCAIMRRQIYHTSSRPALKPLLTLGNTLNAIWSDWSYSPSSQCLYASNWDNIIQHNYPEGSGRNPTDCMRLTG